MKLIKLTYKEDFKKILKECQFEKVGQILTQMEGKLLFIDFNDIDAVPNSDKVSFQSISKNVKVTMKIGRFVNRLFTDAMLKGNHTQHDLERFVYIWTGFSNFDEMSKDFELVSGEDIRKYYHYRNYAPGGTLSDSCMKHASCQEYLDIYCLNPEKVQLLILKDVNGKIKGRAIVWKNINLRLDSWGKDTKEVVTFMDRVYSTDETIIEMFKLYAKKMNWVYRLKQQADPEGPFVLNGKSVADAKFFYYLDNHTTNNMFPFLDTLCYYSLEKKFISNRQFKKSVSISNTDGSYDYND